MATRRSKYTPLLVLSALWAGLAAAQTPAESVPVFRITPVRPVSELQKEAAAQHPPAENGEFITSDLVEVSALDKHIHLDIRYATKNNFLSTPVYTEARAFMQRPAAEALVRVNKKLEKDGYGLLIHDAYRPWAVTWIFWEATPPDKREFVANPEEGSKHNRGCAVDLTLYDRKTGKAVEMPSVYDEMSKRAYPDYAGGTKEQTRLRDRLRGAMEAEGFTVEPNEWWHFNFKGWEKYPIGNKRFEDLTPAR